MDGTFVSFFFFFFNDTATTEIYTLSLHDALPIFEGRRELRAYRRTLDALQQLYGDAGAAPRRIIYYCAIPTPIGDRKSTRLNSSHSQISYAVFCLKKKTNTLTVT